MPPPPPLPLRKLALACTLALSAACTNPPPQKAAPAPISPAAPPAAPSPIPTPPPAAPSPIAAAPPASPSPSTRYLTAALGDSLTAPLPRVDNYLAYLKKRCPESRFDSFGVGGNMVNQMRARLERDVFADGRPAYTHLIVFGGVNDLYSDLSAGRSVAKIQRDLAFIYARARRAGMQVVAVAVPPWGGFSRYHNPRRQAATLELNRWIAERKPAGEVDHVVDAYALLSCGPPERLCPELAAPFKDGLHFGARGHERLGRALHEQVFADCR